MIEDYQEAVYADYLKKKENGILSKNLSNPTTAKLKKECLCVYDKRYTKQDDDILATFFNVDKLGVDFRIILAKINDGAFRALSNHLKGSKAKTNDRNSELLAWLIDFEPRPSFLFYKELNERRKETTNSEILNDVKEENEISKKEGVEVNGDETIASPSFKTRNTIITLSIFFLLLLCLFFFWKDIKDMETISVSEKCMFWSVDRFEAINCKNDSKTQKIPLDQKRLASFIRITKPDTLTKNSIGKVWYVKINGKPEFYTASGFHPTQTLKKLNPITVYILNKYVSYHRHLLEQVIWISITILIMATISIFGFKYFKNNADKRTN